MTGISLEGRLTILQIQLQVIHDAVAVCIDIVNDELKSGDCV